MKKIVAEGGIIVGMNLKKDIAGDKIGRNDVDRYIALAKKFGLGGLTWMRVVNGELDSNIVKYFTDDNKKGIKETMKAEEGDLIFLMAGPWKRTLEGAGLMRRQLAADLGLVPEVRSVPLARGLSHVRGRSRLREEGCIPPPVRAAV